MGALRRGRFLISLASQIKTVMKNRKRKGQKPHKQDAPNHDVRIMVKKLVRNFRQLEPKDRKDLALGLIEAGLISLQSIFGQSFRPTTCGLESSQRRPLFWNEHSFLRN